MGAAREHVERGIELWNNAEFEELLKQWAPDGVEVNPVGTLTGTKAIGDNYRRLRAGYPDLHIETLNWAEVGDTVVVEGELTGTHRALLTLTDGSQLPPTGQRITFRLASVFQLRDGKTVTLRTYYDQLPMMMQLGLVAPTRQP
ncbi:MAG: nuclear transport factor 2 family protein [Dermatophilaceae bacterium]